MSQRFKLPIKLYTPAQAERSIGNVAFNLGGSQTSGIRLRDILTGSGLRMMAGANDFVMPGVSYRKIKLYLSWPGYSSIAMFVAIDCYQVTRANLAIAIARHLAAFVEKCGVQPVSSSGAQWRIGSGAISLSHIVLTSLHNTGGDTWQAEIELQF